jgi:hypothetical protein
MRVSGNKAIGELPRAHGHRATLLAAIRTILPILTLIFGLPRFSSADDFWKQKPPAQWSHAEALRPVRHSSWAKVEAVVFFRGENQAVTAFSRARSIATPTPSIQAGTACRNCESNPPLILPGSRMGPPRLSPSTAFLVRWESAVPVNQAFARLDELGERALAAFQAQAPRIPADRYVITVKLDQPGFVGFEPFAVTPAGSPGLRATLKTRRGTVAPLEIEFTGTGTSSSVHFYFPRTVDGAPLHAWIRQIARLLPRDDLR